MTDAGGEIVTAVVWLQGMPLEGPCKDPWIFDTVPDSRTLVHRGRFGPQ